MDISFHDLKDDRYDNLISEYIGYVENGIPETDAPKRDVLIIGGGIASNDLGLLGPGCAAAGKDIGGAG